MSENILHQHHWPQRLLACFQEMAEQQTNPVLLILNGSNQVEPGRHYPEQGICFGNDQWRTYYHCHDSPDRPADEHGHFHVFTRYDEQWAHLAGLGMDHFGQPLHWFCVNRWVTGGPWLESSRLREQLHNGGEERDGDPLAGRWLLAMLQVCTRQLEKLYQQRDHYCRSLDDPPPSEAFFEDRGFYTLASSPIDIQATLEAALIYKDEAFSQSRVRQDEETESNDEHATKEKSHA